MYCTSHYSFFSGESIIRYIEWNLKQSKKTHLPELEILSDKYFISNVHSPITSLYIHPETNTLIAAGTLKDNLCCNHIEVIDLATGISRQELDRLNNDSKISAVTEQQIINIFLGHHNKKAARVNVAISQDRKILATSSQRSQKCNQKNNSVILWDLQSGKQIHTLKGHINKVTSLAISNYNSILATASEDGTIKEWDIKTGDNLSSEKNNYNIVANSNLSYNNGLIQLKSSSPSDLFSIDSEANILAVAKDGSILAFSKHDRYTEQIKINEIEIFNIKTYQNLTTLYHDGVSGIAISPDGNTIATMGVDLKTSDRGSFINYVNIKLWQVKL
ncbi:WD-40 repeat (fragment) [Hyella patelloides LEGE 07179]|uniref:WD-40 repeat n=1 Tax=Hyella patelloides LEGE 07179 TaxID=945734 RepID=A0A563VV93_9CYAN